MTFLVATNVVASQLPERLQTGTPTDWNANRSCQNEDETYQMKPTNPIEPVKPNKAYQTKQNLPNQTFQTKPTKPNLPNWTCQTKHTKPNLGIHTRQTEPSKDISTRIKFIGQIGKIKHYSLIIVTNVLIKAWHV